MLRLDWNILFNIINLLILYFLMKRFLFKPVNAILEKRQAEADAQFSQAGEKAAQAGKKQQQYEKLLADAETERGALLADARKQASAEYERILEEARGKAGKILEQAQERARTEREAVLQQTDAQLRDMMTAAAAKVAGLPGDAQNDRALYDKFLEKASQTR